MNSIDELNVFSSPRGGCITVCQGDLWRARFVVECRDRLHAWVTDAEWQPNQSPREYRALGVYDLTTDPTECTNLWCDEWAASPLGNDIRQLCVAISRQWKMSTLYIREDDDRMGNLCTMPSVVTNTAVQTETEVATFVDAPAYIHHAMETLAPPLTVFVPVEECASWPTWLVPPLRGAHSATELARFADTNERVREASSATHRRISRVDSSRHLAIDKMVFNPLEATLYVHATGQIVLYRTWERVNKPQPTPQLLEVEPPRFPLSTFDVVEKPHQALDTVSEPALSLRTQRL